jgi:hypothetical protein
MHNIYCGEFEHCECKNSPKSFFIFRPIRKYFKYIFSNFFLYIRFSEYHEVCTLKWPLKLGLRFSPCCFLQKTMVVQLPSSFIQGITLTVEAGSRP